MSRDWAIINYVLWLNSVNSLEIKDAAYQVSRAQRLANKEKVIRWGSKQANYLLTSRRCSGTFLGELTTNWFQVSVSSAKQKNQAWALRQGPKMMA